MPFIKEPFQIQKPIKLFLFLMKKFDITQREAQRFIDKGRVYLKGEPILDKSAIVDKDIEILYFKPQSKGIKPIFENSDFLIYDKPSGILVHPNCVATPYSMLDEIRTHGGSEANATHRIDMETSGLLLASKHKKAERFLKSSFEHKTIQKKYLAWVKGKVTQPFEVTKPIKLRNDYSDNKHKVEISENGKYAKTEFKPIKYNSKFDSTLIECKPQTGRTHQIRIHLFYSKHPILGDPLYGTSFEVASKYLEGELSKEERISQTGAKRLLLHANSLEFKYKNRFYIISKTSFENLEELIF